MYLQMSVWNDDWSLAFCSGPNQFSFRFSLFFLPKLFHSSSYGEKLAVNRWFILHHLKKKENEVKAASGEEEIYLKT